MGEIILRSKPASPLLFTGERLTSDHGGQTEIEHLHRYLVAREWCRGKDVLDVASGEGYGTALFAQVATSAVGIELSPEAVRHASAAYAADNLRYVVGDARAMPAPDASFDVVVSFETIEHFAEHTEFLSEVRRVLRPGGVFIVSTPDRDNYSPADTPANPYHVKELTGAEFDKLIGMHFPHVSFLLQRPMHGSVLLPNAPSEALPICFERRGDRHFEGSIGLSRPQYLIAFGSDSPLMALPASVYIDTGRLGGLNPVEMEANLAAARVARDDAEAQKRRSDELCAVTTQHLEHARRVVEQVQDDGQSLRAAAELELARLRNELTTQDTAFKTALAVFEQRIVTTQVSLVGTQEELSAAEDRRVKAELELDRLRHELVHQQNAAETGLSAALDDQRKLQIHLQTTERELVAYRAKFNDLSVRCNLIEQSTAWRMTLPIRRLGRLFPANMRRQMVRAARVIWWTVTLQLPARLRHRAAFLKARNQPVKRPITQFVEATTDVAVPVGLPRRLPSFLQGVDRPVAMMIDALWPQPDKDAGSIEAVNMADTLMMLGYRVIFAAVHDFPSHVVYRDNLSARGVHCLGPDDGQSIQSFIEEHGEAISLFMLVRGGAGGQYLELIRYNSPSAKIVFYTIDLHFLREERQARLLNDAEALKAAGRTRDWEQSLVKKSDATIVVSTAEQSLVTAAVPGSYVVNLPLCRVDQPPASPFDSRRDIGFVGGFAHLPNVDAVQYFLTEIWPLVHAELPDCRFSIVGADLPADVALGLPAGAQYLGHVQDLEAWLGALRLTVAPLRFGAGMKGKVVSSLAAGVPCVSTSIGVEGMSVVAGEDILVADTPEGIAGELVRAYRDPELWTMLSRNGQSRMQQGNSISGYRRSVHEMLVHIGLPCITPP